MAPIRFSLLFGACMLLSWAAAPAGQEAPQPGAAAALNRRVSVRLSWRGDEELEKALGCRIVVDEAFRKEDLPQGRVIDMAARGLLDWACRFAGGDWVADGDVIHLLSPEQAWRRHGHPTRRYELAAAGIGPGQADALATFVSRALAPLRGRRGGRATLEGDHTLAVTAPPADQMMVQTLLHAVSSLEPDVSFQWSVPATEGRPHDIAAGAGGTMRDRLEAKISFDFIETPLEDVLDFVSGLAGLSILLDAGVVRDEAPTLTLKVNDMRTGSALGWVMKLVGLKAIATDEALLVVRPAQVDVLKAQIAPTAWIAHDLSGILKCGWTEKEVMAFLDPRGSAPGAFPYGGAARLGLRRDEGAYGRADLVAFVGTRVLARPWPPEWRAYQEWAVRAMRLPPGRPSAPFVLEGLRGTPLDALVRKVRAEERAWRQKLERTLEKRISFDFIETPASEILSFISALVDATFVLDTEAARDRAPAVTICLDNVPVRMALDYLCLAWGLGWTLKDEAVFVSTAARLVAASDLRTVRIDRIAASPAEARAFARFAAAALGANPSWKERACWVAARPGYHLQMLGPPGHGRFLAALCRGLVETKPGEWRKLPDPAGPASERAIVARVLAARVAPGVARRLREPAQIEPRKVTLSQAVSAVGAAARIAILVRPHDPVLRKEVRLQGKGVLLAEVLRRVEEQAGATHLPLAHGLLVVSRKDAPELRPPRWVLYDVRGAAQDEAAAERMLVRHRAAAVERQEGPGFFAARWKRWLLLRSAASQVDEGRF